MKPFVVSNNNISLYTETFGSSSKPCIMLIMGATAQGVIWEDSFCERLAEHYFVIRYDHRDTGKSSRINYDLTPYLLSDLAIDSISILDYFRVEKAHFIAASMGSFISQYISINYPERVLSLCLIMSSPNHHAFIDGFEGKDTSHHRLPPSNSKILDFYQRIISISGSSAVNESNNKYKQIWRQIEEQSDEDLINLRVSEGKILRRLKNSKYVHNHSRALSNSKPLTSDLHLIQAPTLIIHGEIDYILPVDHGIALQKCITKSELCIYKNMGHGFSDTIFKRLVIDFFEFIKKI